MKNQESAEVVVAGLLEDGIESDQQVGTFKFKKYEPKTEQPKPAKPASKAKAAFNPGT